MDERRPTSSKSRADGADGAAGTDARDRIIAAPPALVSDGRFNLGLFRSPLSRINPLDARIRGPGGLPLPRPARKLMLKEWQHFAIVDDETYLSVAIFDSKRLALGQVIAYERSADRLHEHERKFAPWQVQLPDELANAEASAKRGDFEIEVSNRLGDGRHEISFSAPEHRSAAAIRGEVTIHEDLARVQPLVVCMPFEPRDRGRAMYSHKAIAPCSGWVEVGGQRRELDPTRAYSLVDIHKGYYPFQMKWLWATGALMRDGAPLGFNLTDNQVEDQSTHNENALWVHGDLHPLPPVAFELDRDDTLRPWRVSSANGQVDLRFAPHALRRVDINLGVFRSRYRGPYGEFSGTITDADGTRRDLDGAYGMCEDFYLRA